MSAFSRRPLSLAAEYARPDCSECHHSITWSSALDLAWRVHFSERQRVFHLIGFCGPDADAWYCEHCGSWGVFSDRE